MIPIQKTLAYLETLGQLNPGGKMVILYLINALDIDSEMEVEGSAVKMGKIIGISSRTFQRHVYNLRDRGIVTIHSNRNPINLIAANSYSIPSWHKFLGKN